MRFALNQGSRLSEDFHARHAQDRPPFNEDRFGSWLPFSTLSLRGLFADAGDWSTVRHCAALASPADRVIRFAFDHGVHSAPPSKTKGRLSGEALFVRGLRGNALRVSRCVNYPLDDLPLSGSTSFSVQLWIRTTALSDERMVLLSQKEPFARNDLHSHKRAGWAFYLSDGTWAWHIGSGKRRLTYERDNGRVMPLNDGRWHQLSMTFDHARSQIRLYFDGVNRAVYDIGDSDGFEFGSSNPLTVGWVEGGKPGPTIQEGARSLQALVDAFGALGLKPLRSDELLELVVSPKRLLERRVALEAKALGERGTSFEKAMNAADFTGVLRLRSKLMRSPYTVHQSRAFMEVAPLLGLYSLEEGRVKILEAGAAAIAQLERLDPPDFDIDELAVFGRPLSDVEVRASYEQHFELPSAELPKTIDTVTAGIWNIEHGGKHFNVTDHGWDSRKTIAEMIRREGVDIVMMQETYSSGDFLAAELGYYLAESVDWDYLNQGRQHLGLEPLPDPGRPRARRTHPSTTLRHEGLLSARTQDRST